MRRAQIGLLLFLAVAALTLWAAGPPPTPAAPANVGPIGNIAGDNEPGTKLIVTGQVFAPDGVTPAPNVIVYGYQTDAQGLYHDDPKTRIARLHGWAKTDEHGRFEFRTIRPGPYPGRQVPAHIHFHIYGGGYPLQWTEELMFAGDPSLREEQIRRSGVLGKFGNVQTTAREAGGTEHCTFNIRASKTTNYPPGETLEPLR
jgi:protocatechuate 3,4-dioxygenase beta subunit